MSIGDIKIGLPEWNESVSDIFVELVALIGVLGMVALLLTGFFVVSTLHPH
jgi:hypothetical protein